MRKWMFLGLFVLAGVGGAAGRAEAGCSVDLIDCYYRAANVDSFWYRWASGIDCELDYVDCTRRRLIGR